MDPGLHGHTSLVGVGCVIDVLTGIVLDAAKLVRIKNNFKKLIHKLSQSGNKDTWHLGNVTAISTVLQE